MTLIPPYCVSRLIQFLRGCYRFHIYRKRRKINTLGNGRCTQAWAAIVLFFRIAALSIFGSVKFNDSLFFKVAIVIFCTQGTVLSFQVSLASENCTFHIFKFYTKTSKKQAAELNWAQ